MIYRVLVLLFAILLIAAGSERVCAEVSCDSVADILDEDAVIHVVEMVPPLSRVCAVHAVGPRAGIAPAPALMRVFRPPRTERV